MQPESPSAYEGQIAVFYQRHRTGLVTLVFTDLVDSTALMRQLGDQAGTTFLQQRRQIVRQTLKEFPDGEEIETAGDSFLLIFAKPSDAVRFALLVQAHFRAFRHEKQVGLLERIGIHLGEVVIKEHETESKAKDLYGIQIGACARVMSLAQGGQVLMTRGVFDSARQVLKGEDIPGVGRLSWVSHGPYLLKGLEEPTEICEVGEVGQSPLSAPKTGEKAQRYLTAESEPVLGWRPAIGQEVPNTKWVLEQKLGEGGFGEVWLGYQRTTKERRVFKFCFQAERVRFLKRELTLFRLLKERVGDHPNIVRLHDIYLDQAPFYVEMDYVEGSDLRTWCEQQGGVEKVSLEAKLEIVAQVADGLQAAHDAGVIHRDVKPGNILVKSMVGRAVSARRGGLGEAALPIEVKLTDFGIGQVVSEEFLKGITRAGFTQTILSDSSSSHTGTQMYMAPELLAGKPASIRSDIYSLGVVLYQLLVGDFSRPVATDWANDISDPLLREDLKHCFAGNPNDRFAGAGQLANNLRALPDRRVALERQQAALAAMERAAYRRGIARTAGLAAVIVALVTGLAMVALHQSRKAQATASRESHERKRAENGEAEARRLLYAADMNLAQQALKANNLGRTRRLLDRYRPSALNSQSTNDLRGWEWRYLWQECRSDALTMLTKRDKMATSVSFAVHGRTLAVGYFDGRVELWDVPNRRLLKVLFEGSGVHARVAFSPNTDLLAATAAPGVVKLHNLVTGGETNLCNARPAWVRDLSFSNDGALLAVLSTGKGTNTPVLVLEATDGRLVNSNSITGISTHFGNARLSSDHQRLYLSQGDSGNPRLQCVRLPDWKILWEKGGQDTGFSAMDLSPDGRFLVTGTGYEFSTIQVWNAQTGEPLAKLEGHTSWVGELAFSRDGRVLASASADQTLHLWNAATWEETAPLRGHGDEVWAVAISPDGRFLASGGKDGAVMLWDARAQKHPGARQSLPAHIVFASALPGGQALLAQDTNRAWSVIELVSLRETPLPISSQDSPVFRPPNYLGTYDGTNRFRLYEVVASGLHLLTETSVGPSSSANFAYFPRKQLLALGEDSQTIQILSLDEQAKRTVLTNDIPVTPVKFGGAGRFLLAVRAPPGLGARTAVVWDLTTGEAIVRTTFNRQQELTELLANEGSSLVTFPNTDTVEIRNLLAPERAPVRFDQQGVLDDAAFSPDGRTIALCTGMGIVVLYDAVKQEKLTTLHGHLNAALGAAFSPDGRRLASTSGANEAVKLWDVATGQELLTLPGRGASLDRAEFADDGNTLLVGGSYHYQAGLFQFWRAPAWAEIEQAERHGPAWPRMEQ